MIVTPQCYVLGRHFQGYSNHCVTSMKSA